MATRVSRPRPKVMTLTDAAAERVLEILGNSDRQDQSLRVGVKNGGCAGMAYTLDYVDEQTPLDEVIEEKGVRILIDPKAVMFLLGTQMDFQVEKLSSGFVFNNPNQTGACGCGESVIIKPIGSIAKAGLVTGNSVN